MTEYPYIDTLERAEQACAQAIHEVMGTDIPMQIAINNRCLTDTAVFDIGYLYTGETQTFHAGCLHWRATLDLYARNRADLQRRLMLIIGTFPINDNTAPAARLRTDSPVVQLRICPDQNAVSAITTTDVQTNAGGTPARAWVCTLQMDVVFYCGTLAANP